MHRTIFIALAALAAGAAVAQETARNPADARVTVPAVEYRSAFDGYQRFAEEKVAPWRESNDAVKAKPKPPAKPPADARHGSHR